LSAHANAVASPGAGQVSLLAVDIANPHPFGRTEEFAGECKACVCSLWGDPEKFGNTMHPIGPTAVLGAWR
jgi:hypothetical protein